jgi:hypothetical protein
MVGNWRSEAARKTRVVRFSPFDCPKEGKSTLIRAREIAGKLIKNTKIPRFPPDLALKD